MIFSVTTSTRAGLLAVSLMLAIFHAPLLKAQNHLYTDEKPPPKERLLGDEAFKKGLYDLAVKFYSGYKKNSAEKPNAMLDACRCLIAAYVHSGNAQKAREEFNFLTTKFAERIAGKPELKRTLTYWDGNIIMESGDPLKAAEVFGRLADAVPEKQQRSEIFFNILDALGTAQARSLQWVKAEKTYAMLAFAAKGTKWQADADKKRILAVMMMGDYKTAERFLKKLGNSGKLYVKVMRGILLLKEGYLNRAFNYYKSIRKYAAGPDSLWFMLSYSLANAFLEKKEYKNALFTLNDALLFATSEFERQQTLIRIINAAMADGNIKAAIVTAERFLQHYPDAYVSDEIRLKLAKLYADAKNPEKKTDDALQVLITMLNDNMASTDVKIKSAREAAHIYISLKRYEDARTMFKYMVDNAPDPRLKGEGAYWIAELQYIQGKNKEAAELYAAVAAKYPDWREKALYREIKALMNTQAYNMTLKEIESFLKEFPESKYYPDTSFMYALALKNADRRKDAEKQFAAFSKKFPSNKYAARSLFEEGLLAMEAGRFQDSVSAFTQLYEKYPDSELVPNALYRREYGFFWEGFDKEAVADVGILTAKYPFSEYTVHARFRLVRYYIQQKNYTKALETLKAIAADYAEKKSEAAARAYYETADIYFLQQDTKKALMALDDLSAKFPDQPVALNGLFLRGEVFMQNNEYEKAIPFYIKAAKGAKGTLLQAAAEGRAGDCYFALGDKVKDGANYLKATEFYRKVLAHEKLPSFYRDQALYKIGLCEEAISDKGKALSNFQEVMIRYDLDNKHDLTTARSSVWFAKSALKAANIYLEKDNPEAAEAAIAVYATLIRAGIEPVSDFKRKIDIIRDKYKLKE